MMSFKIKKKLIILLTKLYDVTQSHMISFGTE